MPIGEAPGVIVSWLQLTELLVHSWDLSRAGGDATPMPAELAAPALAFSAQLLQLMPRGQAFAPAVACDGDPSDRLVAFLGRDPAWMPPR